jgi:4-hydroxybenzoate polyprenyltransferase
MTYSSVDKKARPVGWILFAVTIVLALLITGVVMSGALSAISKSSVASAATVPANCGMNAKTYLELPPEARFQLESDAVCK